MKYTKPLIEKEAVEVNDIILTSITDNGTSSLGTIEGNKGTSQFSFFDIF